MRERPILFKGAMVRAIIDGTKTQTRRVVTPQPSLVHAIHQDASITTNLVSRRVDQRIHCPFGQPGDRLWVREQVRICDADGDGSPLTTPPVWYMADGPCPDLAAWSHPRPSIHMPKWASRITLEITEVRVQRLQDISEDDARAEGCSADGSVWPCPKCNGDGTHAAVIDDGCASVSCTTCDTPMKRFSLLWDSLAAPGARWEDNPWVWAVSFQRVEA